MYTNYMNSIKDVLLQVLQLLQKIAEKYCLFTRVRPIRVKWPMSDVPIFRRKNSDSDVRCLVEL